LARGWTLLPAWIPGDPLYLSNHAHVLCSLGVAMARRPAIIGAVGCVYRAAARRLPAVWELVYQPGAGAGRAVCRRVDDAHQAAAQTVPAH